MKIHGHADAQPASQQLDRAAANALRDNPVARHRRPGGWCGTPPVQGRPYPFPMPGMLHRARAFLAKPENFKVLDADGDGKITRKDLVAVSSNRDADNKHQRAAAYLLKHERVFAALAGRDGAITLDDLKNPRATPSPRPVPLPAK